MKLKTGKSDQKPENEDDVLHFFGSSPQEPDFEPENFGPQNPVANPVF